ncbi:hypothetical protein JB92DRAFT_3102437 [Gautieria morchelliformis]|nr:hypothetical protein JB92DRAFT_3102437 [Gautieria morchelliformis]
MRGIISEQEKAEYSQPSTHGAPSHRGRSPRPPAETGARGIISEREKEAVPKVSSLRASANPTVQGRSMGLKTENKREDLGIWECGRLAVHRLFETMVAGRPPTRLQQPVGTCRYDARIRLESTEECVPGQRLRPTIHSISCDNCPLQRFLPWKDEASLLPGILSRICKDHYRYTTKPPNSYLRSISCGWATSLSGSETNGSNCEFD